MKVLVDADACPVINRIEDIAKRYCIKVILFADTSHIITSDYSEVQVIDKGADAVDFAILKECCKDDIVVTQDYGLGAMVLGKGAKAIHHCGREYTRDNINNLLLDRYIAKKEREKRKGRVKCSPREKVKGNFDCNFERLIISEINVVEI